VAKFLSNKSLLLSKKFNDKITDLSIQSPGNLIAISRKDYDDKVEFIYKIEKRDFILPKNRFIKIVSEIPNSFGCENCMYIKDADKDIHYCSFKQKRISAFYKTCKYFSQEGLK